MTLGMMVMGRGLAMTVSGGHPIHFREEAASFAWLGQGNLLGLPVAVWIFAAVAGAAIFVLRFTAFGRNIYAVGSNPEAARLSGINVGFTIFCVYVISGLLSALTALIFISRLTVGEPVAGVGLELEAIAITVIGGTSLFGGEGSVAGTILGAAIIAVLANILNLFGVSPFTQQIVKGAIIVAAVLFEMTQAAQEFRGFARMIAPPRGNPAARRHSREVLMKTAFTTTGKSILAAALLCAAAGAATTLADDKIKIGFSQGTMESSWRVNMVEGNKKYAESNLPDVDLIVTNGENNASKQVTDVESLIAQGVKTLIISPVTADALTPVVKQAMDAGIPVVTLDRKVNTDVTLHIGADNKLIGETAGKFVCTALDRQGQRHRDPGHGRRLGDRRPS